MNEETNNTPQAPDFEGEEMKMPENSTAQTEEQEKPKVGGWVIMLLGLILLAILIGLYLWFTNMVQSPVDETPVEAPIERPTPEENDEPESTTAEAQTDNLETVSTSDEISAIESDLEATDLDSLDAELLQIEAELNAAF